MSTRPSRISPCSKAEGIPFFIEEFIKSLRELKIIEQSNGTYKLTKDLKAIAIPSTIQDVIMARVDHLPEGAREVLRTGSVIEREFSHELIRKVTGLPGAGASLRSIHTQETPSSSMNGASIPTAPTSSNTPSREKWCTTRC